VKFKPLFSIGETHDLFLAGFIQKYPISFIPYNNGNITVAFILKK
jgi:hypothetical protein